MKKEMALIIYQSNLPHPDRHKNQFVDRDRIGSGRIRTMSRLRDEFDKHTGKI
jgi:hypothetical protein